MSLNTLIIDDDVIYCSILRRTMKLAGFGHKPVTLRDGKEALEYLEKEYKSNDNYVLFLDINMPIMNGWEFLESLEYIAKPENTFVYVVSSSINDEDFDRAKRSRFVLKYINKPVLKDTLNDIKRAAALQPFFLN